MKLSKNKGMICLQRNHKLHNVKTYKDDDNDDIRNYNCYDIKDDNDNIIVHAILLLDDP